MLLRGRLQPAVSELHEKNVPRMLRGFGHLGGDLCEIAVRLGVNPIRLAIVASGRVAQQPFQHSISALNIQVERREMNVGCYQLRQLRCVVLQY